jgi:predicted RNA-binding protein with PUA-like domain
MSYWLIKSEPDAFSIDDLRASPGRKTCWDGVRNYQARNFMRDRFQIGDRAFFYHSNCAEPGIVGIARVVSAAYPDHTAFDPGDKHYDPKSKRDNPTWYMVDIRFERKLKRTITLTELKRYAANELEGMLLLRRGNRLSITPVGEEHWSFVLSLE